MTDAAGQVGFVAIGRNEGERMVRCLQSLLAHSKSVVYVDSGSGDGSPDQAERMGAQVVRLSDSEPFTAARARNAGVQALLHHAPDIAFIMYIDGDCELIHGFVDDALQQFRADESVGVVTGRCRERYPGATPYNQLCDLEWDGPVGEIDACGGIFMARRDVVEAIGGFDPTIIAAEDDDFCIRARATGRQIWRIDRDMCFHDANIRRFGQWWRRSERAGHAYAQLGARYPDYFKGERRRAVLWGGIIPAVAVLGAPFTGGLSLFFLGLFLVSMGKIFRDQRRLGRTMDQARLQAAFLTLAKFPNLIGILKYNVKRMLGAPVGIVEYKAASTRE